MAIPKLIEEDRVQQRATSWTRGEVAEMVRQMIRDQLGVKTFSDDADFIKDLGMD